MEPFWSCQQKLGAHRLPGRQGAGAAQSHRRQRVRDAVNHSASSGGGAYIAAGTGALCSVSIPSLLAL